MSDTRCLNVSVVWVTNDWVSAPVSGPSERAFEMPGINSPEICRQQLSVCVGTTIGQFADNNLVDCARSSIEAGSHGITVFGRRERASYVLQEGDRIELTVQVTADPKADRHRRVAHERSSRGRSMWKK